MHSRSIEFAKKYRVPLRVRPSYSQSPGSLIAPPNDADLPVVTGLAVLRNESRVSLCDIPDRPGVMSLIFTKMARLKIPIDMVVQDVAQAGRAEVSFTVPQDDLADTLTAAEQAVAELGAGRVQHGTNVSKLSVVGLGMRTHTGVAAQLFQSLADAGVNIGMITTSEIKISTLVSRDQCDVAAQAAHAGFRLHEAHAAAPSVGVSQRPSGDGHAHADLEQEVVAQLASMEDIVVSDVFLDTAQARVTIRNVRDVPGVAAEIFAAVAEGGVMVDMIVQNVSHSGLHEPVVHGAATRPRALPALGPRSDGTLAGRRAELRRGHGQAIGRGNRPADAHRGGRKNVPRACRRGHQRPADQHQRDPHLRRRRRQERPRGTRLPEPRVRPLSSAHAARTRPPGCAP